MGSIQSSTMILCALGNRSASFLSRRAHLLTTPVGQWYFRWKSCALRGGCGFCGSLMDNATSLRSCCHCPRSWCAVNAHRIPSLHRRYSTNCPHKPATAQGTPFGRGSVVCGYDPKFSLGSFSLWKEKQKLYERIGSKKWRSIIWKPRSSAGAQGDPPAQLLPI